LNHAIAKSLAQLEAMKESRSYVQFIQDIHQILSQLKE